MPNQDVCPHDLGWEILNHGISVVDLVSDKEDLCLDALRFSRAGELAIFLEELGRYVILMKLDVLYAIALFSYEI